MTALRIIRRHAPLLALARDRGEYDARERAALADLWRAIGCANTLRNAHRAQHLLARLVERGAQRDLFAA